MENTTIEELLKLYLKKARLPESVINKDIVFLFQGAKLDAYSQVEVGKKFENGTKITVFELKRVIAG